MSAMKETVTAKAYGTRAEHLLWAKERALEYANKGALQDAVASMASDLRKHADLGCPDVLMQLGIIEVLGQSPDGVRRWIEGFN